MATMARVRWNILVLAFASLVSAACGESRECARPPQYANTVLDQKYVKKNKFSDGEKVYYNCAEDFTPYRGSRSMQCMNGQWTKLSLKCEKKSCGNAGHIPNGQFEYEGNSLVGEKVYVLCNEGYTLKGLNYRICKNSGWTGKIPICEVTETTCSSPAVDNSVNSGRNVSFYRVGDNVTVTCSQSFQLDGAEQITCGPDGKWEPQPPRCLPLPETTTPSLVTHAGGCGVPPADHKPNINLADKYITMTIFASGDRVQYVCDVGYVPARGRKYRTCKDGKWTPLSLNCERKVCGSAGEILNGEYTYTGVEFGDKATAVCDNGYILVGHGTRNCMSTGWDRRVPICEAVVCEDPPEVKNADMKGLSETPYTYRSVVIYQCRVGTLIGRREIWCTKNGTWSEPPPQCKETTCAPPNVPNAFWRGPTNNMYQHRDTITIECNQGYAMTGPHTVSCDDNGRWLPRLPKCSPRPHVFRRKPYRG